MIVLRLFRCRSTYQTCTLVFLLRSWAPLLQLQLMIMPVLLRRTIAGWLSRLSRDWIPIVQHIATCTHAPLALMIIIHLLAKQGLEGDHARGVTEAQSGGRAGKSAPQNLL